MTDREAFIKMRNERDAMLLTTKTLLKALREAKDVLCLVQSSGVDGRETMIRNAYSVAVDAIMAASKIV